MSDTGVQLLTSSLPPSHVLLHFSQEVKLFGVLVNSFAGHTWHNVLASFVHSFVMYSPAGHNLQHKPDFADLNSSSVQLLV